MSTTFSWRILFLFIAVAMCTILLQLCSSLKIMTTGKITTTGWFKNWCVFMNLLILEV
ncbi:hypothetical protein HNQ69_001325 [Bartonella callosciuri]|uniref:Uncharacterized protein n=1 Tax=Bartonella callosciuri TaxID=686223 RepID=A0A840NUU3_9HYPH|nr:hypothetical protein [Bartonella callosciuri]